MAGLLKNIGCDQVEDGAIFERREPFSPLLPSASHKVVRMYEYPIAIADGLVRWYFRNYLLAQKKAHFDFICENLYEHIKAFRLL